MNFIYYCIVDVLLINFFNLMFDSCFVWFFVGIGIDICKVCCGIGGGGGKKFFCC